MSKLVPAFFVYGPVFSMENAQQLVGVVVQTFLIESLVQDLLMGFDNLTIQFLVRTNCFEIRININRFFLNLKKVERHY